MNEESATGDMLAGPFLPIGVRAWPERPGGAEKKSKSSKTSTTTEAEPVPTKRRYPHEALVFDTETKSEAGQGLLVGIWRLYVDNLDADPATHLVEEGFFYPDDLPETDPAAFETLRNYVSNHAACDIAPGKSKELLLWPVSRWLEERLFGYGYKHRDRCTVVGFNLPFDLGGLAQHFGAARPSRSGYGVDYFGGWSLSLFGAPGHGGSWNDLRHRPRLRMKSIDPRRTLIGWAPLNENDPRERAKGVGGRFVDLRTLAFALTDRSLSLETACDAFGHAYEKRDITYGVISPEILDYGREDVAATAELYRRCLAEIQRHVGVDLAPHRLYSPATVGARYLEAMGLARPLDTFALPAEFLGGSMSAFYGGRAEARIVRTPVPVVVADFTSMYPAQNGLQHTWEILTAERLELDDVTHHVQSMIEDPDLFERLHHKETWAKDIGVTFVEITDIDGAILPVRGHYQTPTIEGAKAGLAGSMGIGINPLHYDGTLTYALPDVLAACLMGPRAFRIVKATRLRAVGQQSGLQPVKLRGAMELDPRTRDPFLSMIEDRHRALHNPDLSTEERNRLEHFLKITANATSYGSLARFDRSEKPDEIDVDAYGPAGMILHACATSEEAAGPYCFPPVAASITAGARLILAMMETHITRRGGSYAFMDTDSTAIVATEHGGRIPCVGEPGGTLHALSHDEVYDILTAFDDLNPFGPAVINPDPRLPGSPWKIEKESTADPLLAYVISTKRYLLYRDGPQVQQIVGLSDCFDGEEDWSEPSDLVDWSEHGLGLYQDPVGTRDEKKRRIWMREGWEYILDRALGNTTNRPDWAAMPAITQFTMSSPRQRRWFGHGDTGTPTADTPRPGGFGLLAQATAAAMLGDHVPMPVGPYETDPEAWDTIDWYDRSTGTRLVVNRADAVLTPNTYATNLANGQIDLRTLGNVLDRYQLRIEHKSLAPDGTPTTETTQGKLRRRPVHAHPASTHLIGKEANKLVERVTGADPGISNAVTDYGMLGDPWTDVTLPILREMDSRVVASKTGVTERRVRDWRTGKARPHDGPSGRMALVTSIAADYVAARDADI